MYKGERKETKFKFSFGKLSTSCIGILAFLENFTMLFIKFIKFYVIFILIFVRVGDM
jgi:hypothetical protein